MHCMYSDWNNILSSVYAPSGFTTGVIVIRSAADVGASGLLAATETRPGYSPAYDGGGCDACVPAESYAGKFWLAALYCCRRRRIQQKAIKPAIIATYHKAVVILYFHL